MFLYNNTRNSRTYESFNYTTISSLTLTRKNFIPISNEIMLCVVCGLGSLERSSFNSTVNRFLTDWNRDCARMLMTSAYRSATVWILLAFGPVWTLQKMRRYENLKNLNAVSVLKQFTLLYIWNVWKIRFQCSLSNLRVLGERVIDVKFRWAPNRT